MHQLDQVQPFHVAAFVKELQGRFSPPTVKQHLAAIGMLFDWLVTGQLIGTNPAHTVRGPKYVVKKGKTPVLDAGEARALLDAIPVDTLVGLRDRALIGVMVYTFARINAVLEGRRGALSLLSPKAPSTQLPPPALRSGSVQQGPCEAAFPPPAPPLARPREAARHEALLRSKGEQARLAGPPALRRPRRKAGRTSISA